MTQYPDTPEGAQALLRALRARLDSFDASAAKFIPDPFVAGCWLATWPDGARTIVYTHPHPVAPNFEEVDSEES